MKWTPQSKKQEKRLPRGALRLWTYFVLLPKTLPVMADAVTVSHYETRWLEWATVVQEWDENFGDYLGGYRWRWLSIRWEKAARNG